MIIRLNSNYSWKYTFKVFTYCASIMLKLCWIGLMNMKYSDTTPGDVGAFLHVLLPLFVPQMCKGCVNHCNCVHLQSAPQPILCIVTISGNIELCALGIWAIFVICWSNEESLRMINPIRASRCNECSFGLLLAVALWSKLKDLGSAHPATLPPLHCDIFTLTLKQINKQINK